MTHPKIRVLIVDNSPELTDVYARYIGAQGDLECVGALNRLDGLIGAVRERRPRVVLADLNMPGHEPLAAIRRLREQTPDARALIFSGQDDPKTVLSVIDAGAWGLVPKHAEPSAVMEAVRRVARGECVLPDL